MKLSRSLTKNYKPIVLARMIGTYGIILGYFITLHISTYIGAMFNIVFELMALPFYIKNKMYLDLSLCAGSHLLGHNPIIFQKSIKNIQK